MKYIGYFLSTIVFLSVSTGCNNQPSKVAANLKELDLSAYSAEKPEKKLNLLFIHHSCGATLMADKGGKSGEYCLWPTHPNGGGLRKLLQQNNYNVHEATYGSKIGQETNINHWYTKFQDYMDIILKTDHQNNVYKDDSINQIIVFKSCYPNNKIKADGTSPGDPDSPERTLWNCKAAYNSLLPIFREHPGTLFVAMTAPPIVKPWMNRYKEKLLNLIGKGPEQTGNRARVLNNWLKDAETGWLKDYDLKNVVVFDLYDILTGKGESNWTKYATRDGKNSHPNAEGNAKAAEEFIPFLNRLVRYSSIAENNSSNHQEMTLTQ